MTARKTARSWPSVRAEAIATGLIRPRYRLAVEISREGRWWMIRVPALCTDQGTAVAQARRKSEIPRMVRELITVELGVPFSSVAYPDPEYLNCAVITEPAELPGAPLPRRIRIRFPDGQVVEGEVIDEAEQER